MKLFLDFRATTDIRPPPSRGGRIIFSGPTADGNSEVGPALLHQCGHSCSCRCRLRGSDCGMKRAPPGWRAKRVPDLSDQSLGRELITS
jgi:hypothetical protein